MSGKGHPHPSELFEVAAFPELLRFPNGLSAAVDPTQFEFGEFTGGGVLLSQRDGFKGIWIREMFVLTKQASPI